ncbi:hypothetical protein CR231_26400 (plasmid) [Klebsiella pneumoniae]|nr:hypothetical protein CR231_26400 [Klebsiella pneumoniae]
MKMPAFEWVHVQLHQQKGMISLSPPTICNSAVGTLFDISSRKEIEQQLLRMVITDPFASRLREHVRATDMAARIGGRNSLCCWKRHR